jgi:hypothetical protein
LQPLKELAANSRRPFDYHFKQPNQIRATSTLKEHAWTTATEGNSSEKLTTSRECLEAARSRNSSVHSGFIKDLEESPFTARKRHFQLNRLTDIGQFCVALPSRVVVDGDRELIASSDFKVGKASHRTPLRVERPYCPRCAGMMALPRSDKGRWRERIAVV